MLTRAHWAAARCRGTVRVEDGVWIHVRVRRRRPFECSDFGVLSLLAALIECGLFIAAFTGERCQEPKTLCAAARWLGIITVDVLLMAGSVSTILIARADCLWSVDSTRAGTPRGLMLHHRLCWKTRGMRSFEHGYVARRVWW